MIVLGLFAAVASLIAAWRWWRRYWRFTPRPVPGLAVDVIVGEDHLMTLWGRSAKNVAEEIRRAGSTVQSPLRLWMVFLAEGEGVRPGFVGIRRAAFSPGNAGSYWKRSSRMNWMSGPFVSA